jgi:sugar fermentation stimulation protein A
MRFASPLRRGTLVRRYKRFLADVLLEDGGVVVAHCPNSGSMLSVDAPGSEVWLSFAPSPTRRTPYAWELIRVGGALVGINTGRPNRLVADAVAAGAIATLAGYSTIRREVRYGSNSRIDLLLEADARPPCYVEVKNVTLRRGQAPDVPVEFPDSVTERGSKHLRELAQVARTGGRAVQFFLAQRADAERLTIARDIDPVYSETLTRARAEGVEVMAYRCNVAVDGISVAEPIEFVP